MIRFGPLSEPEVAEVLTGHGVSPASAVILSSMSAGSVERALQFQETVAAKPTVLAYLDAVQRHDRVAITTLIPRWNEGARVLMWRWVDEVLMDWPRVFTKAEIGLVHKIGVAEFYRMVELMRSGLSVDLVAYEVWRRA